jgi:hypothetical protein
MIVVSRAFYAIFAAMMVASIVEFNVNQAAPPAS